jgi:hypothetical protein
MATALAPLVAPVVGAARTHRACLTGAARGCVSPDGSASARVRARGRMWRPRMRPEKRRTEMQGSEGSAERRVWSAAAASEAVEEAPKGATGAVASSAASRSTRRRRPCHRVHAITVSMSFHRACHAVCVCVRARILHVHVRMRMERERESEREETGERERSESEVREAPALPSYFFYGI